MLIDTLRFRGIYVLGTLMKLSIPKTNVQFSTDKDLQKFGRGSHDMLVNEEQIGCCKMFGFQPNDVTSSKFGVEPLGSCKRWSLK